MTIDLQLTLFLLKFLWAMILGDVIYLTVSSAQVYTKIPMSHPV